MGDCTCLWWTIIVPIQSLFPYIQSRISSVDEEQQHCNIWLTKPHITLATAIGQGSVCSVEVSIGEKREARIPADLVHGSPPDADTTLDAPEFVEKHQDTLSQILILILS